MKLTAITPVAPRHQDIFEQCRRSVLAQTIPVKHLWMVDKDGKGPGYIRNRLIEKVDTPYVTFLDADDWLEPTFAEEALAAIKPSKYVYTDWWQGDVHKKAPNRAWCQSTWHVVTAVMETFYARSIGGFDEHLAGMEDTDFYAKLLAKGICGIRLPKPLMHYRENGGRALTLNARADLQQVKEIIKNRYKGIFMACCGFDESDRDLTPVGQQSEGDVLAQALWRGNRKQYGRATGREYPRMAYPRTAWVNPKDVQATPHLWREVDVSLPKPNAREAVHGLEGVLTALSADGIYEKPMPVGDVVIDPDFDTLIGLSEEHYGTQ